MTDGSHCSVCGEIIVAQQEVAAIGHNFSNNAQYCLNGCGTENTNYVAPSSDDNNSSSGDNSGTSGNNSGSNDSSNNGSSSGSGSGTNNGSSNGSSSGSSGTVTQNNQSTAGSTQGSTQTGTETDASDEEIPEGCEVIDGEFIAAAQKNAKISKLKKGKKKITAQWKKVKGVKGYQVQAATDKKFTKNKKSVTVKKQKTTKTTIKKLKSNKKYYVRIRTYKVVDGKKVYSKWSKVKTVKTK